MRSPPRAPASDGFERFTVDGKCCLPATSAHTNTASGDGLATPLAHTGLVADGAADTRLLHKLLEEATHTPQSGEPTDSPVILERKSARSALMVRIVPGPGLQCCCTAPSRKPLL